jgi:hypothetical protein
MMSKNYLAQHLALSKVLWILEPRVGKRIYYDRRRRKQKIY